MTLTIAATNHSPVRIEPWHGVEDEAKFEQLLESMTRNGWLGAPIVVFGHNDGDPQAINGSHRIHAAREADIDVPTIELTDLLTAHGVDLGALLADYTTGGFYAEDALREVVVRLDEYLPADVVEFYGLDAH